MIGRYDKLGLGAHVFILRFFCTLHLLLGAVAVRYGTEIFMNVCHIYLPPPPSFYRRLRDFISGHWGERGRGEASVCILPISRHYFVLVAIFRTSL